MTNISDPAPALIVIYARDIEKVAAFYARTLARPVVERDARFVVVGDAAVEVAVVRIPDSLVAASSLESPSPVMEETTPRMRQENSSRMQQETSARMRQETSPRVREETPLKPSFLVDDLEAAVAAAAAAGGGTKPLHAAWGWRGQLHLDGHDPEGNPVQFRTRAPLS
jgi:catechol 2,3-dioxygenase-like lactoylglutathione lyase family enzyme